MKKVSCDIIRDILPLYVDGVVSEATKEMVEEHLSSCASCKKEAEILKQELILPSTKNVQLAEAKVFKKLKAKFRKKNTIILLLSVITVILLAIGIHSYAVLSKTCISYDGTKISVEEADGKLYAVYRGENLGGTVATGPSAEVIDGKKQNIVVFYYYETPWSKYIQPIFEEDDQYTFYLGDKEEVDQIYYGEFESDGRMIDSAAVAENAEQIWGE